LGAIHEGTGPVEALLIISRGPSPTATRCPMCFPCFSASPRRTTVPSAHPQGASPTACTRRRSGVGAPAEVPGWSRRRWF